MAIDFLYPQYEVVRNPARCIACRACERQCSNEVHAYDDELKMMISDESRCVNCHRCVSICPTRALKIVKTDHTFKENANWSGETIMEVYRQASSGGVLLSSMGNPKPLPVYWDKILINASQVTNPSIDPLREPMETKTFLGQKPSKIERDENGKIKTNITPQLELSVPIMFSAMSYGSISYNAHESLARAAEALGIYYNTGEGGLHQDFYKYDANTIVQVASGRFGVHKDYLSAGAAIEIKMGQGAKPGIGGHLPGAKIVGDVSRTRMIPEGSDAISPAPHHDIYSIEDLRQLVFSLKEASNYKKPVIVKLSPNVTSIANIAKACEDAGADGISLINTVMGMRLDLKARKPLLANSTGGMSGPALFPLAVRMVWQVYEAVRIPIVGLGGVMSAEDVIELMLAGATAVEVGAANLVDPFACRRIVEDLPRVMQKYNINDLNDIIGGAHHG